jgi:EF hand
MDKFLITVALGAAMVSTPLLAQQGGGQRDQTRAEAQQRADMMFQMIDANHDGTITKAEAQTALAQFEAMRGGGGGDNGGRGGGRMQRMLDQLFATSPSITQPQLEALMLARFDAQDLNHDGTVTAAEREQARAARQAAGGATAPVQAPTPAPVKPQ